MPNLGCLKEAYTPLKLDAYVVSCIATLSSLIETERKIYQLEHAKSSLDNISTLSLQPDCLRDMKQKEPI